MCIEITWVIFFNMFVGTECELTSSELVKPPTLLWVSFLTVFSFTVFTNTVLIAMSELKIVVKLAESKFVS